MKTTLLPCGYYIIREWPNVQQKSKGALYKQGVGLVIIQIQIIYFDKY